MPREHRGRDLVVTFDPDRCAHGRRCVLALPDVFGEADTADTDDRTVDPEGAPAELVAAQVRACPSGALRYTRLDGGVEEPVPGRNVAHVVENGPLELRGDLRIEGGPPETRAAICRCAMSQRGIRCDGTCGLLGFEATGDPQSVKPQQFLAGATGEVALSASANGPYLVQGNLEVVTSTGRTLARTHKVSLCRCGASANKPFCDGAHERIGYRPG